MFKGTLLLLAACLTCCTLSAARPPSPYTAEWIKVNAGQVQGKAHSVRIAYVMFANRGNGRVEFNAMTYDDDQWGGTLQIVVPEGKAGEIQKRYGSEWEWKNTTGVQKKRFDGIVHVDQETGTVFVVDPDAWQSMSGELKEAIGAGVRTWTSSDGVKIQAELVDATEDSVTIRRKPDDTEFTIPLTRLCKDDQDYVVAWRKERAGKK